ncbi:uncharacterized protein L969DRAFT_433405 [Mixia osmundae IAM 14324]|nr:uncharacterized protein L969DRAFT_433405 [Mixia osmundae IAM 14324]KEI39251.1 hypothetical protein L969DRAFT_433405 [Mixia osmundae IAM 14324]
MRTYRVQWGVYADCKGVGDMYLQNASVEVTVYQESAASLPEARFMNPINVTGLSVKGQQIRHGDFSRVLVSLTTKGSEATSPVHSWTDRSRACCKIWYNTRVWLHLEKEFYDHDTSLVRAFCSPNRRAEASPTCTDPPAGVSSCHIALSTLVAYEISGE